MSCLENQLIYENCLERFWDLMDNYEFQCCIFENFLDAQEQFQEKEFGFNEDPYNNAFDLVWAWDCESVSRDVEHCIKQYVNYKELKGE